MVAINQGEHATGGGIEHGDRRLVDRKPHQVVVEVDRQQFGGQDTESRTVRGHGGEQPGTGNPRGDARRERRPTCGEIDHGGGDRFDELRGVEQALHRLAVENPHSPMVGST
jgi:hypothetical protein